jgi:hypothetical protein
LSRAALVRVSAAAGGCNATLAWGDDWGDDAPVVVRLGGAAGPLFSRVASPSVVRGADGLGAAVTTVEGALRSAGITRTGRVACPAVACEPAHS